MITVDGHNFELIENKNDCFDIEEFEKLYTDYFYNYDYIVGDIAYSKLRLKGFYTSDNKKVKPINNIDNLSEYIDKYCAYGCKYFVLKQEKSEK